MISRRLAALGLGTLAASAFGNPVFAASRIRPAETLKGLQGRRITSESLMVVYLDPTLQNGFSLRASRYPTAGLSWIWCQVLVDGRLFSYSDHTLPCRDFLNDPEKAPGNYGVPGHRIQFTRHGTAAQTEHMSFDVSIRAHDGGAAISGPGPHRVRLAGSFLPQRLKGNTPPGRFERTGTVTASITVDQAQRRLSGIGKGHEQSQDAPRFDAPFTYAMLWGPGASLVAVRASNRFYGEYEVGSSGTAVKIFGIDPPNGMRRVSLTLADGRVVAGSAETAHAFDIPIWGQNWHGHIVAAEIEGRRLVGMINDWRPEDQAFGMGG